MYDIQTFSFNYNVIHMFIYCNIDNKPKKQVIAITTSFTVKIICYILCTVFG